MKNTYSDRAEVNNSSLHGIANGKIFAKFYISAKRFVCRVGVARDQRREK